MKKLLVMLAACILVISMLAGCSKSSTEAESTINQPSTGSPSPILSNMGVIELDIEDAPSTTPTPDHIWLTLNNIQIHQTDGEWVSIQSTSVPLDLISLGESPQRYTSQSVLNTTYNEISFGIAAVSVQVGNQSYNASVPSGSIRLVGNFEVANNKATIVVLDFEADQSLLVTGNNQYNFKPAVEFRTPKSGGILGIMTPGLDNDLVGVVVRDRIAASGGNKPYTFNITSGSLPPGVTLSHEDGSLGGAPTKVGTYNFVVQVKDSSSPAQSDTVSYTIRIAPANSIIVVTSSVPNGLVNEPYDTTLFALGGNGIYTWKLTGGNLPPGLLLTVSPGSIDGTPTKSGSYSFNVQVQDSSNPLLHDTQTITLLIE